MLVVLGTSLRHIYIRWPYLSPSAISASNRSSLPRSRLLHHSSSSRTTSRIFGRVRPRCTTVRPIREVVGIGCTVRLVILRCSRIWRIIGSGIWSRCVNWWKIGRVTGTWGRICAAARRRITGSSLRTSSRRRIPIRGAGRGTIASGSRVPSSTTRRAIGTVGILNGW